jgi:hypothetical protein
MVQLGEPGVMPDDIYLVQLGERQVRAEECLG